jgi:hypothetical protein
MPSNEERGHGMMAHSQPKFEQQIYDLLHDYGPHLKDQIVHHIGMSRDYVGQMLEMMKQEGRVTTMRRGNPPATLTYWLIAEDA